MPEASAKAETLTIVVDGRRVAARPGEMVIAAAERAGTYIPRFCYHPRMKPVGMCRMCLVEIKGPRGFSLQPACYVPVAEGQEVVTDSPKVRKAQEGVLEFLLINHPLDCPVCDKGGECPLQDQTLAFGPGETRFVEEKTHFEKPIALSPFVHMDRERCILCDRCTRFSAEVAGDPLISFIGRGDTTEVNVFPEHPFASYFSGNTVQICPVGALLARPYRFKARPWDLEQVESTCTMCAVGCRVAVQSSTNSVIRYLGLDSDQVNHGWLCDKGRWSHEYIESGDRLTAPLVRKGDQLVTTSWGEALAAAARGLGEARDLHGARSVAVLGGARLTNEDAYAWAKLAKSVLGTDNVDAQLGDGLPAEVVLGVPRATIDQACAAPTVLLLSPDLKEELPVLHLRLREAAVEGGVKLVELTPKPTGLTPHAATSLFYRPGEVALVARALVAQVDPPGEVGGVGAAAITAARRALSAAADSAVAGEGDGEDGGVVVVLGRPSLAESAASVAEAASVLAALPGARFLPALRRANVHGALDMGLAPGLLPGRVGLDDGRAWFAQAWGRVPDERGLDATGVLTAAAEGRLQGLVLIGADPLSDFPDGDLARRALTGAGFVVAVDCLPNASTPYADVVLAAASYAERPGTTTNLEGRVSRLGQKVVAPGIAWADWIIATELAFALGADLGFERLEGVWDEIERLAPSHAGITRGVLGRREHRDGVLAPLPAATSPSLDLLAPPRADSDPTATPGLREPETHGLSPTRTLLAEAGEPQARSSETGAPETGEPETGQPGIPPEPAQGEVLSREAGVRARPVGQTTMGPAECPPLLRPPRVVPAPLPRPDSYSVRLVSGRTLYDGGTLVQQCPSFAPLPPPARVRLHPGELDSLGVAEGGRVRLKSAKGSLVLPAVADARVPRGSAVLAHNLPGAAGGGLLDATLPVSTVRLETP